MRLMLDSVKGDLEKAQSQLASKEKIAEHYKNKAREGKDEMTKLEEEVFFVLSFRRSSTSNSSVTNER